MIPIIFAMAFVSFPYLIGNIIYKMNPGSQGASSFKIFVENYLNIYTNNPSVVAVSLFFILIIMFTFFYSWVTFKPERMSEQIQKRGGYIP